MEKNRKKSSNVKGKDFFEGMYTWQIVLLLTGLILLLYIQTIAFQFSWFDDDAILLRNKEYVSDPGNMFPSMLRDAEFREKSIELYRPLQNATFILEASISGLNPGLFHFSNVVLHFIVCVLALLLFTELGFRKPVAAIGSMILAIHPVFAFTVSWIPARGDLLLALWTLFALLFFIRYLKQRRNYQLFLHLVGFALALLSKESGIIIPFIAIFYYLFIHQTKKWERWQMIAVLSYVVLLIPYFYLRSNAIADVRPGAFGIAALLQNMPVVPETLLKFFVPYPIVALPFYSPLRTTGGILIIALIIFIAIRQKKDRWLWLAGAGWFLAFTLPAMLYRPDWSDYIYDYIIHRSYLPFIGIILLVLLMIQRYAGHLFSAPWSRLTYSILILFMILSFSFTRTFRNPITFWDYAVRTNPASPFAHTYLGGAYFFAEEPQKAIESYTRAIGLKPDFREAVMNRGITLASIGRHAEAIRDFTANLDLMPDDTMALAYRATSYIETGNYPHAKEDLKVLLASGQETEKILYQAGLSHLLTGAYSEAGEYFGKLLDSYPARAQYLRVAALADLMQGNADGAIKKYLQVFASESPDQNTLSNLGYAYYEKGEYTTALDYFKRAMEAGAESLSLNLGLLLCYDALGRKTELAQTSARTTGLNKGTLLTADGLIALSNQGYLFTPKQKRALEKILQAR